jgi:hypothetical protein
MIGPRMVPAEIPQTVRDDPKRRAEVQVFEQLRDDPLLEGFTVYYSCWWTAEHDGLLRDGEADFVAAHPDIGFIAIEVKGGVVSRKGSSWSSRGAGGMIYDIQDPVAQARKSKKVFLEALKRAWPGRSPFIWARHGVILPHSSRPKAVPHLGAAMPLDIFAFEEDMPTLGARLMAMLMWRPEGSRESLGLGSRGIAILDDLYGRDFELKRDLMAELAISERRIVELTDQQKRILDTVSLQSEALIVGGAGTGKSVLAVEKAARIARSGGRVLLLCFNKPLSVRLRQETAAEPGVTVETFHACCTRLAEAAGLKPERLKAKGVKQYYSTVLPGLLEQAIGTLTPLDYDAVIVDEGQDFRPDWLVSVRRLVKEGGSFLVLADANQSIYNRFDLAAALGVQPSLLCDNVRNTQQIFGVMSRFYTGPRQDGRGPDGLDVRWVEVGPDGAADAVERQLNELALVEGIAPEEIAVLTGCAVASSALAGRRRLGEFPVTNAGEPRAGHVVVDSVHRFKGLDSCVILLTHMDDASAEPELPYVALSRGKSLLVVIGGNSALKYLENAPLQAIAV